jgi:hypothetical protein
LATHHLALHFTHVQKHAQVRIVRAHVNGSFLSDQLLHKRLQQLDGGRHGGPSVSMALVCTSLPQLALEIVHVERIVRSHEFLAQLLEARVRHTTNGTHLLLPIKQKEDTKLLWPIKGADDHAVTLEQAPAAHARPSFLLSLHFLFLFPLLHNRWRL